MQSQSRKPLWLVRVELTGSRLLNPKRETLGEISSTTQVFVFLQRTSEIISESGKDETNLKDTLFCAWSKTSWPAFGSAIGSSYDRTQHRQLENGAVLWCSTVVQLDVRHPVTQWMVR